MAIKARPNPTARPDPSSLSSGHRRNTPPQSQLSSRSRSLLRSGQAQPLTLSFLLRPSSHKITLYIQKDLYFSLCDQPLFFDEGRKLEHQGSGLEPVLVAAIPTMKFNHEAFSSIEETQTWQKSSHSNF
ncbi:uncharacterized protein LOC133033698 isoform X1 [Cannabis sativa]|uniref:uncharacterized protein LOC133033698 isoform X1 n=1 Tax=Cannabis sativa TaxID=3483 RepID=UPI0029CA98B7|nr:uncharacterized protein LOC133033698 isoform X1 [Cannabis sativa]XP_060964713.1 uncharacterized protein LOC133033698 isoform X1 [Cannabis sativa]XP_060964714.1 uncharacterized protein LOC133033698 isoform X1 [Cannabis sativa]